MKELLAATVQDQIDSAASGTGASKDVNSGIGTALSVVFGVIAVVAVIMVIIGGISIATSQGDPSKIKKGKMAITYGLIGMAVALLAFAIVNLVLSKM